MAEEAQKEENIMRTGDQVRFVGDILRKQTDLVRLIETRTNVALGFAGLTLTFALNAMRDGLRPAFVVVSIAALIAIALCLMALKPPRFLSQRSQKQSVFYHTATAAKKPETFIAEVKGISEDLDRVLEQYALETYNLVKHSIVFKKKFAHLAITVLTAGFVLGALTFAVRSLF